jgi:hypothetical protein
MNIFLITGSPGTGKSYLTQILANNTEGAIYIDLLSSELSKQNVNATMLVVDHVCDDSDVDSVIEFASNVRINNLILVGQDERDYSRQFENTMSISGKPGERTFELKTPRGSSTFKEGEQNNLSMLMH